VKLLLPIILQAVAFAVGVAEVLIPSFGILTLIAVALFVYSWYYILQHLSGTAALGFGIADLIMLPVVIKIALNLFKTSNISLSTSLPSGTGLQEQEKKWKELVGQQGIVVATLRPGGQIKIGEEIYEATTLGDFIEKETTVQVVSVEDNKIIVEYLTKSVTTKGEDPR